MKKNFYLLALAATMLGCGDGEGDGQSLALTADNTAVVLVDMQPDFTQLTSRPKPNLAVKGADKAFVNSVKAFLSFCNKKKIPMIATQDWHPEEKDGKGHISLASAHGKKAFQGKEEGGILEFILHNGNGEVFTKSGLKSFGKEVEDLITYESFKEAAEAAEAKQNLGLVVQALWPDHCVQGTEDAELVEEIAPFVSYDNRVKKGQHRHLESYSGFYEGFIAEGDKRNKPSELNNKLKALKGGKIENIVVIGLALDYCVNATAQDGVDFSYNVYLLPELSRGVGPKTTQLRLEEMKKKGVKKLSLEELKKQIK
ncbi:MAG: isochorismatase family protein [Bacteroidota bacterium]